MADDDGIDWPAVKRSSNSSAAVPPELVPISEFSNQSNTMNRFHIHLERELALALGSSSFRRLTLFRHGAGV